MANLSESQTWESGVYQVETSDKVIGGTIIKPTSVNGAGRWKRNITDTVSVVLRFQWN